MNWVQIKTLTMRNKCNGCPSYRPVVLPYLGTRYLHSCAAGKYYLMDEIVEQNIESSYLRNSVIFYSDKNLKEFWKRRIICLNRSSFFIDKIFPNLLAIGAIIISLFALFSSDNKKSNNNDLLKSPSSENNLVLQDSNSKTIQNTNNVNTAINKIVKNPDSINIVSDSNK